MGIRCNNTVASNRRLSISADETHPYPTLRILDHLVYCLRLSLSLFLLPAVRVDYLFPPVAPPTPTLLITRGRQHATAQGGPPAPTVEPGPRPHPNLPCYIVAAVIVTIISILANGTVAEVLVAARSLKFQM
ncbi:hypothetical protein FS749_005376 [Ceratobasidium sp. UAMH 11750]|nr:hypothetical protein FS749_005376 [Ceratobasidium sp. UAMH 11750]